MCHVCHVCRNKKDWIDFFWEDVLFREIHIVNLCNVYVT